MKRHQVAGALAAALTSVLAGAPISAQAQDVLITSASPLSRRTVAANATGTHLAVLTSATLVPDDTDAEIDLYIRDLSTATWARVAAVSLQQPNRPSLSLVGLSNDGRYVAYSADAVLSADGCPRLMRLDTSTKTSEVAVELCTPPETKLARWLGAPDASMSRDGQSVAYMRRSGQPVNDPWTLHVARVGQPSLTIAPTCYGTALLPTACGYTPVLSADGARVAHRSGKIGPEGVLVHDVGTGAIVSSLGIAPTGVLAPLAGSADLRYVAVPAATGNAGVADMAEGYLDPLAPYDVAPFGVSDDGSVVIVGTPASAPAAALVHDRRSGLSVPLGSEVPLFISATGRFALTLGGVPGAQTVTRWDLDADGDAMLDVWETTFGLDPTDPADASLDANGDGTTNLAAFEQRRHPTAVASAARYFAEGASGSFATTFSVFNAGPTAGAALLRFQGADGEMASRAVPLPAFGRADVSVTDVGTFRATEFSTAIDSDVPLVAERRMTVGGSHAPAPMHASAGAPAPAETWHFAEGATVAGLQTFYLLLNPGDKAAEVTFEYLMQPAGKVFRQYTLAPGSRTTVWANMSGPEFDAAQFALTVRATRPVVAERAMYRLDEGHGFVGATNALGVTAPSTSWSFAEGAVGDFFDMFVLVANPGDVDATVTAQFKPEATAGFSRTFLVPAGSRYTIWVDHEGVPPPTTAVSVALTSDEPVVAERVMWWPGDDETWGDGHAEFGATATGYRFAIADGELDAATQTDTFLLVDADTGGVGMAQVRLTLYPTVGAPIERDVTVGDGRTTLWLAALVPEVDGQRFAAIVEALDGPGGRARITVEKALYSDGLQTGAAALATRLPD